MKQARMILISIIALLYIEGSAAAQSEIFFPIVVTGTAMQSISFSDPIFVPIPACGADEDENVACLQENRLAVPNFAPLALGLLPQTTIQKIENLDDNGMISVIVQVTERNCPETGESCTSSIAQFPVAWCAISDLGCPDDNPVYLRLLILPR
jgi:hypothetical protein